jgi:hypothetical protein
MFAPRPVIVSVSTPPPSLLVFTWCQLFSLRRSACKDSAVLSSVGPLVTANNLTSVFTTLLVASKRAVSECSFGPVRFTHIPPKAMTAGLASESNVQFLHGSHARVIELPLLNTGPLQTTQALRCLCRATAPRAPLKRYLYTTIASLFFYGVVF